MCLVILPSHLTLTTPLDEKTIWSKAPYPKFHSSQEAAYGFEHRLSTLATNLYWLIRFRIHLVQGACKTLVTTTELSVLTIGLSLIFLSD